MPMKVIIERLAKPGKRSELLAFLENLTETHGPSAAGFLGASFYEVLDDPDALVEIAEWESAEAQAAGMKQWIAAGHLAAMAQLVAARQRRTRVAPLH